MKYTEQQEIATYGSLINGGLQCDFRTGADKELLHRLNRKLPDDYNNFAIELGAPSSFKWGCRIKDIDLLKSYCKN